MAAAASIPSTGDGSQAATPTRHYHGLGAAFALPPKPLHLAVGMFDGVHLGHRAVIESAALSAQRTEGISAALTFHPHPSRVLRPEQPVRLIQAPETKAGRLLACGIDAVITETFTRELASIEATALLPHLRASLPHLAAVYVGENWRFGRGRLGDVSLLVEEGRKLGLNVVSAPRINHNGEPISSTRIRAHLEAGEIAMANTLLGYSYVSTGRVVRGKRLGRSLGFPTLNIPWDPECRPRFGVYAVRLWEAGQTQVCHGVANYGLRPTVEETKEPRLEVHVIGGCPFDEGSDLVVEWLDFLRPEIRFEGVEQLKQQVAQDVGTAAEFHRRQQGPAN